MRRREKIFWTIVITCFLGDMYLAYYLEVYKNL